MYGLCTQYVRNKTWKIRIKNSFLPGFLLSENLLFIIIIIIGGAVLSP
jgi:hypothetical protein